MQDLKTEGYSFGLGNLSRQFVVRTKKIHEFQVVDLVIGIFDISQGRTVFLFDRKGEWP
jgi:hypothetical protein